MRLRRLVVALHRDVGYAAAGLTLVYAVSGVAVNHVHHWNPTYDVRRTTVVAGTLPDGPPAAVAEAVLARLEIAEEPQSVVPSGPGRVKVFLEQRTLTVAVPEGVVEDERVTRRPVLYQLNFLHLNHGKGAWTLIADLYAGALALLALTGVFIVPGRKGLGGRGRWLMLAGIAVPLLYLLLAAQ